MTATSRSRSGSENRSGRRNGFGRDIRKMGVDMLCLKKLLFRKRMPLFWNETDHRLAPDTTRFPDRGTSQVALE